jgi:dTDP-4-dehydrorhamnose reductase
MKVCVLGHRGMLGHTVARFLAESGRDILTVSNRYSPEAPEPFLDEVVSLNPDWCVNAIGLAPRGDVSAESLMAINGDLPAALSSALPTSCGLIHPSTDGVFSPQGVNRSFDEIPDATDDYGVSKQQAEAALNRENDFVIRCSIIGPDPPGPPRNLLSWFLNAEGSVDGYSNHLWNGITTLQSARLASDILAGRHATSPRPLQPASQPAISKCDLLRLIAEIWGSSTVVNSVEASTVIARTLAPNIETPPLSQQLRELRDWSMRI